MPLEFQFAHRGTPPPYSMLRGQLSLHKAGALAARLPPVWRRHFVAAPIWPPVVDTKIRLIIINPASFPER